MPEGNSIRIRRAEPEDAETLCRITREAFQQYQGRIYPPFRALEEGPEEVREGIEALHFVYGLAMVGEEPVGHIRYRIAGDYLHVSRLAVLPPYRHRGIGRILMGWVEQEAKRLGLVRIRGETRTVLKDLLQYYHDMGYESVGYASLGGIPRSLTLLEKRLDGTPAARTTPSPAAKPKLKTGLGVGPIPREKVRTKVLHPSVKELLGLAAHRSTKNWR